MSPAKIKELLLSLDPTLLWVVEFMRLVSESGVEISSPTPGRATAKEILADAKIHKLTTAKAEIESLGFDELISTMMNISPTDQVLITGLIGSAKRGVLYYTPDEEVLGGVVVTRRLTVTQQ